MVWKLLSVNELTQPNEIIHLYNYKFVMHDTYIQDAIFKPPNPYIESTTVLSDTSVNRLTSIERVRFGSQCVWACGSLEMRDSDFAGVISGVFMLKDHV